MEINVQMMDIKAENYFIPCPKYREFNYTGINVWQTLLYGNY